MFDIFKKKDNSRYFTSPVKGKSVTLQNVKDETFSSEVLGKGVAIIPSDDTFYAPCSGTVALVFSTKHAISIKADTGEEILIHIGLETVELNGKHFEVFVSEGDRIERGQKIATANIKGIEADGYDPITSIVITNTDEFQGIDPIESDFVDNNYNVVRVY